MSVASLFRGGVPQYKLGAPDPAALSESPMVYTTATRTVAPNATAKWGDSNQQSIAFTEDGGTGTSLPLTLTTTRVRLANGTYATTASCEAFTVTGCTGGGNSYSFALTQFYESENVVAGSALVFTGGVFELATVQLVAGVLKVVTLDPLAPGDHVVPGFSFTYISL